MDKLLELGMQALKDEMGYDNMLSAVDLGQEVVFFGGEKDNYGDCGIGISINKITLLAQAFDENESENWKRLHDGTRLQIPAKYQ